MLKRISIALVALIAAVAIFRPAREFASGIASAAYNTVQNAGTPLTQRPFLNMTGAGVSCADNAGQTRTDCTISGGGAGTPGATLFSSTTQAGPSNTASETSLIGTVTGSKTIAANTFTDGAILEVRGQGYFSLPATADALTLKAKCGSTVLGSATFTPGAGVLTNGAFRVWLMLTAIGSGASGAFATNGLVELSGSALTDTTSKVLNTSNVSFDFTTACAFDLTAQWGGAQVGESITGTNVAAWIPGAPVTSVGGLTGAIPGQGNGAKVQMSTGTTTTNDCVKFDANGNTVDAGAACGSGGGSVTFTPPYQTPDNTNFYGPVFALTQPPAVASFSWVNQGNATVSQTNTAIFLNAPAANGDNLRLQVVNTVATPYTYTAAFIPFVQASNFNQAGLCFYESATGKLEIFAYGDQGTAFGVNFIGVARYNSVTSFNGNVAGPLNFYFTGPVWMQLQNDNTNLTFNLSADGQNFLQFYQEAKASFFTTAPDRVGFCAAPQAGGGLGANLTLISWKQT